MLPRWIVIASAGLLLAQAAGGLPASKELKPVKIYGRVTDFSGAPIAGAAVELKDRHFATVATDTSDKDGRYHLQVQPGTYLALAAVKDYQVSNLEYWAWNVPADTDLEINPRFDRLEVYALNAWQPQGAYPSYQVYFRPMSLLKVAAELKAVGSMDSMNKLPVLDIAPTLHKKGIEVTINGQKVPVLELNKVREACSPNQTMVGYLIQVGLPAIKTARKYDLIDVVLTDLTTGEKGEGCLFERRAD